MSSWSGLAITMILGFVVCFPVFFIGFIAGLTAGAICCRQKKKQIEDDAGRECVIN